MLNKFWLSLFAFNICSVCMLLIGCEKEISDHDGNNYQSVKIGTQIWMTENLKSTRYNDNTEIPNITNSEDWIDLITGAYCWYQNDINKSFGALYNWYAVNTGKLCPVGWHVPSHDEWTVLENYLITNGYNYDGTITDNKIAMALAAETNWAESSSLGGPGYFSFSTEVNTSGFSGLPGGRRARNGDFTSFSYEAHWWSSTMYDFAFDQAWEILLQYECFNSLALNTPKYYGLSVRCIKD